MAKLSAGQILTLARAAGFSSTRKHKGLPEDRMMVAIALGESGGNPQAHNAVPPDNSYGLTQINMIGSLGPDRRKKLGISSNEELFNPAQNLRAAKMVFDEAGGQFRPWSVYTSGSWMRYRAQALNATPEGNIPSDEQIEEGGGNWWDVFFDINPPWWTGDNPDIENVTNDVQQLGNALSFITDPNNWKRVGLFIGGGVLLIIGTIAVMDRLGAGKAVTSVASKIPAGRLARGAAKRVT